MFVFSSDKLRDMDLREVERRLESTSLQNEIAKIHESVLWASPYGRHYHIEIDRCGVVSDPIYHDEYVIIHANQVFKRELQPCQCALSQRI